MCISICMYRSSVMFQVDPKADETKYLSYVSYWSHAAGFLVTRSNNVNIPKQLSDKPILKLS